MAFINIAVTGCGHGELDTFYRMCGVFEKMGYPIDLVLITGDFQAVRNQEDLGCMETPTKYRSMRDFYKYYSGEKVAPILTIVVGGNHEAINHQQELYYGGWVAPNIYYLGASNVIRYKGLRIGGISGIFKSYDYEKGYFESVPYGRMSSDEKNSSYHYRHLEILKLLTYSQQLDIMLSHDWPEYIYNYGNLDKLLEWKPWFSEDISNECLGSLPLFSLLQKNKPKYWFAAHLHTKFPAIYPHDENTSTHFLALDKCVKRRDFIQVVAVDIDPSEANDSNIYYDPEWLMITKEAQKYLSTSMKTVVLPETLEITQETRDFVENVVQQRKGEVEGKEGIPVPRNFAIIAPSYCGTPNDGYIGVEAVRRGNNQTDDYLAMLDMQHIITIPLDQSIEINQSANEEPKDPNVIDIDISYV